MLYWMIWGASYGFWVGAWLVASPNTGSLIEQELSPPHAAGQRRRFFWNVYKS